MNFRLSNGLEVVLEENHAAPVVAFQAWVKVGSADETPAIAGLAHFTEHMLFKGTAKRGVGQIAQEVEAAGGEINAWTSYDETAYHLVLAKNFFDTGLDILADTLQHSSFDPEELERERKVVLEEIKQGLDDPDRLAAQGLFQAAFDVHPYGRPIIGSAASVGSLTREQMVEFVRRHYVAPNVTLVVVGDIDAEQAREAIVQAFGGMSSGDPLPARIVQPEQKRSRVRAAARDVKECQLLLGFHVPAVAHEDVPALDLLATVLGQGESSRLNLEVVRNRQLVTAASAYTFSARNPGLLVVGASLPPGRLESAARALLAEILRLGSEEIPTDEMAKSRRMLESERVFDKETVQGYARKLGFFTAIAGDVDFEERYFQRLSRMSPADLRRVAARYLNLENLTLYAQVPEPKAAKQASRGADLEKRLERVVAAAQSRGRRKTTRVAPATDVVRQVFPSGLRALVLRDTSVPIVSLRATWVGGLRYEDERTNGISSLLASLLTRGTKTRSAEQIINGVEGMAGALSGYAGRNSLGLSAELLARHWEEGLELVADCLQHPTMSDEELDRERRIALDDIRAQDDNLSHVAFRAFHEAIWLRHPYRLDPLGTTASIRGLTRRKLQSFFREHYGTDNLTLAIVGDVDPPAVMARLRTLFDADRPVKRTRRPAPVAAEPLPQEPRLVERFLDREQAHLVIGFPGVALDHPDRFSLELLSQVLSGQGGRLFSEIREKRGLAYRVSAFSLEGLDPGYFAIYVGTSPHQLAEVEAAIQEELRKLRDDGVGADELERAQRYLIGAHAIGLQRKSAIAAALAFHEAYGQGWRTYREYADRLARVKPGDLQKIARRYLRPSREVTAVVRPPIPARSALAAPVQALASRKGRRSS